MQTRYTSKPKKHLWHSFTVQRIVMPLRAFSWHKQRCNFFYWLLRDVCKTPEGIMMPKYLFAIRCLLFPLEAFDYWRGMDKHLGYNFYSDTLFINGIKISRYYFHLLREGESFKIIKLDNGVITVKRLEA